MVARWVRPHQDALLDKSQGPRYWIPSQSASEPMHREGPHWILLFLSAADTGDACSVISSPPACASHVQSTCGHL